MKSALVLLLAVTAIAAAAVQPGSSSAGPKRVADKAYLEHQRNLLRLFVRPHQYNLYKDQAAIGKAYSIKDHASDYRNATAVQDFLNAYKQGMLPRGEIFSVFYPEYLEEAIHLFNVFYYAKDVETFYKTACWARDHVNEGQFVYALSVATLQREDCKDFVLPPAYEVYPHLFLRNEVIQNAYEVKMQGEHYTPGDTVHKIDNAYYIPVNYSGWYYKQYPEQFISYFTEDVGLNAFHTYWNFDYPVWANSRNYNVTSGRRGELFYYTQHQLMNRYYLERLSNGLGEVQPFSYYEATTNIDGFKPSLRYQNGKEFPMRHQGASFGNSRNTEELINVERRVHDTIDLGYAINHKGEKVSLRGENGINLLGEIIEGSSDSVNENYYGSLYNTIRTVFGHSSDYSYRYGVAPNALEHFETALRDPAYYTLYKRIDNLFTSYKNLLPAYNSNELTYPGYKIDSVEVDKLVTYFDNFDIDLDNAVDVGIIEDGKQVNIQARQTRLNHVPYTYKVKVTSDKAAPVTVRVFLGPKYDSFGNEYTLEEMRDYMVEMDRFTYKLVAGANTIERNSQNSSIAVQDKISYRHLFDKLDRAIAGEEPYYIDESERHCGWPQRLLLPKGQKGGMTFRAFVMVTPVEEKNAPNVQDYPSVSYCGVGKHGVYPDNKPMGYPFDRTIYREEYFYKSPNMHFGDVNIYHATAEELNVAV